MPRGAPDFGAVGPRVLTAPSLDPGEMAVRLGSPVIFDRLGTVLHTQSGSALGPPRSSAGTSTARSTLVPVRTLAGGYSLRMAVTGAGDAQQTGDSIPYLGEAGFGLEAIFEPGDSLPGSIYMFATASDGVQQVTGGIRRSSASTPIAYYNFAGGWTDAPDQPDGVDQFAWQSWKVTLDPATGFYLRAVVNGERLGVEGIAGRTLAVTHRRFTGSFHLDGVAGNPGNLYLAHLIYTVNEE